MGNSCQFFSSNPLFSCIVTLHILILLYFPNIFHKLAISLVLFSTLVLLLFLLRFGASQQILQQQQLPHVEVRHTVQQINDQNDPNKLDQHESDPKPEHESEPESESKLEFEPNLLVKGKVETIDTTEEELKVEPSSQRAEAQLTTEPNVGPEPIACNVKFEQEEEGNKAKPGPVADPKPYAPETFIEWDVWAPLEIIYESYEGEEGEKDNEYDAFTDHQSIERHASLSRYYPETDTDTGTDSSSSSSLNREEEEERDGLIEIALDYYGYDDDHCKKGMVMKKLVKEVEVDEEDNLIEIDISPTRMICEFSW